MIALTLLQFAEAKPLNCARPALPRPRRNPPRSRPTRLRETP